MDHLRGGFCYFPVTLRCSAHGAEPRRASQRRSDRHRTRAGALVRLRAAESTGRPLGADEFIEQLERRLGRALRPRKPGRKPRALAPAGQLEMGIEEMGKVSP